MRIILDRKEGFERSVVALGMFDGVHIGHRVLLRRGAELARQRGVPLVVSTFAEHPMRVIAPDRCPPMLCTFEERSRLMEALGVDVLCAVPFTPEVMNLPPEEYVGHLVRRFHPTDVVCGYNHTFGSRGSGTPALLAGIGAALGFATSVVPRITYEGADVSSTAIRGLIAAGDVDLAARMLQRPYQLAAEATGARALTLLDEGKQLPPDGGYRVLCADGAHAYPAVARLADGHITLRLPTRCALSGRTTVSWLCGEASPL